jgi:Zn-dependent protease/CBS domain-containing protein
MAGERGQGVELFRLSGVTVAIDYSWLVIFALVFWVLSAGYFPQQYPGFAASRYWIVGLIATLLFFASVLIHELSHAWVANRLGEKVNRITLFIFGGMAHLAGEPETPAVELKVAGVGPLTSLVLGALFWGVQQGVPASSAFTLWRALFRYLAYINVALALFNLLPGFPLDGGRLLRAIIWWRTGSLIKATSRAADWGQGIAFGVIGLGAFEIFAGALIGGLWLIFIGLFLRSAALSSYQHLFVDQMLSRMRLRDVMVVNPVTLAPDLPVSEAVEKYFLHLGFSGFPVVEDGRVLGMVSLSQVSSCPAEQRPARRVRDIMRPLDNTLVIPVSTNVAQALHQMAEADAGRLVVMEDGHLAGLITRSGIARLVQLRMRLGGGSQPAEHSAKGSNIENHSGVPSAAELAHR